jgi:citrate lyase subunit beta/citryl-CoA lyase
MLDLEDAVPAHEKAAARRHIRQAAAQVARGGAEVFVRVNSDPGLLRDDLAASVHPGLDGICLPKTESAEQVRSLDATLGALERERGLPLDRIEITLIVETPRGLLALQEIATASARVRSISLGPEDYCLELGVEPSREGAELLYPLSHLVTVCKAAPLAPLGLLGSIAEFRDLQAFEGSACRARDLGCVGAACIHPDQVAILNRVFSPEPERVEAARRIAAAFEEGLTRGTASVSVDGAMVDTPVYERARRLLDRAAVVTAVEQRKAAALSRLG